MAFDTLDTQPYCNSLITLSNGNLTATGSNASLTGANQGLAQSVEGKTAGKWAVEIKCLASGGDDCIGPTCCAAICQAGGNSYGMIGTTGGSGYVGLFGIGYRQDGDINANRLYLIGQSPIAHWGTWGVGDYIYLFIDLDNQSLWYRINNGVYLGLTNTGNPATNTGGIPLSYITTTAGSRFFPAASFANSGSYQFNFGATAFNYPTVPSGFTTGWTNTGQTNLGSFLSNGLGGFYGSQNVIVSPYVCGTSGTITALIGVNNAHATVVAIAVIYDSDGAAGAPGTLLAKSTSVTGGPESVYTLNTPVNVVSGHTYYLGIFLNTSGGAQTFATMAGGVASGMWIDSTPTYPTPNNTFTVSSTASNHIPMLSVIQTTIAPSVGALVFTGYAPTLISAASLAPPTGALTFTGYVPTLVPPPGTLSRRRYSVRFSQ